MVAPEDCNASIMHHPIPLLSHGFYPGYGYGNGYAYPYSNSGYAYPNSGYVDPNYGYGSPAGSPSVGMVPAQGRFLGIDEQAVVDAGVAGMQVVRVYPGSPAEQGGLQVGDVILSANGYLIERHGNLTWVIANAAPDGVLNLAVRSAADGQVRRVTTRIP